MRIAHVVLTIYGGLFALLGLGFWSAPDLLAPGFGLDVLAPAGFLTLQADLGGLFVGLAGLCLYGVWARRRGPLAAALALLVAIALGRLFGVAVAGSLAGLQASLAVEAGAIVALGLHIRWLSRHPEARQEGRPAKAVAVTAAVFGLAGAAFAASLAPAVQDWLYERGARQQVTPDRLALMDDDALRVAICGSSSPLPSHRRAKACVAVLAGGKIYIVDAGPESVENLVHWGLPLDRIGGVLLSHFHSDHIGDLGELNLQTWVQGRPGPLAVYGGPGVERVVAGFSDAYSLDQGYRTAHHGPAVADAATWPMTAHPVTLGPAAGPGKARTATVLRDGGMTITAIDIDHEPVTPAYAFRFDYKGRSVVVTGDGVAHAPLAAAAQRTDLFVAEALSRPMVRTLEAAARDGGRPRIAKIMGDIQSYHADPREMAELANRAGAKMLVLYHLIPSPDNGVMRRAFVRGLDQARKGGRWDLADDGSLYTLPLGSDEVRVGRVPRP